MYSLAASSDPDRVRCVVPWRVNAEEIFFGPCKKRIRELLRKRYLKRQHLNHCAANDDKLFIVGVNGSNRSRTRKIVWAGKLTDVMTFAYAYEYMQAKAQYHELLEKPFSPLHVKPIHESGRLVGYKRWSTEHSKDGAWVLDLLSKADNRIRVETNTLFLLGDEWDCLDRDCCMMLENLFFAEGQGLEIDKSGLEILRQAQPKQSGIDPYAIFGRDSRNQPKGLRGTFLEISGPLADRFLEWLKTQKTHGKRPGHAAT
jgi:hypothetical protein